MTDRDAHIGGPTNVHDLGGLERRDGTMTSAGVFLRSEALDRVTAAGWESLRAAGVATVVDLRRPEERTASIPDDIDLVVVDLDGDEDEFWAPIEADGRWGTSLYYSRVDLDVAWRCTGGTRAEQLRVGEASET